VRQPSPGDYAEAAALREAIRSFEHSSDQITVSNGMTCRAYQLLLMVKTAHAGNGRAALSELETRLKLGKSTVTELVLRCEGNGLVRRELEPNRRGAIAVCLTHRGERRLAKTLAELGDERRRLLDILQKLATRESRPESRVEAPARAS
jgi:DNA-binding MarR family transcriptional regulator